MSPLLCRCQLPSPCVFVLSVCAFSVICLSCDCVLTVFCAVSLCVTHLCLCLFQLFVSIYVCHLSVSVCHLSVPAGHLAVLSVYQLAPLPYDQIRQEMEKYSRADLRWAQEEHKNMGGWSYVQQRLYTLCRQMNDARRFQSVTVFLTCVKLDSRLC